MAKQVKSFLYDGMKAINAWDVDSDVGWSNMDDQTTNKEDKYYRSVPWLYRAARDRSNNVGKMPFAIMKGDKEVDNSNEYKNVIDCMPNPTTLFKKIELSIVMHGSAYVLLEKNKSKYVKSLKYLMPATITVIRDKKTGEITGYERTVNGGKYTIPLEDILPFYDTDYQVEIGPPLSSPAMAALTSAGVLYNIDVFASNFFKRGAIKATVLTTIGFTQDHADRLQKWWDDVVAGVKNAWSAVVLRGEEVKATTIGEGMESLTNLSLTDERRQNIATALGVPESKMWSSAANYATRIEDERAYFEGTIIPECDLIAEVFNEMLFTEANKLEGYFIDFNYENLDIFQADTKLQAEAAQALINTGMPMLMAYDKVGIELSDVEREELLAMQSEPEPEPEPEETPDEEQTPEQDDEEIEDMKRWKRKAIKAYKAGKPASVPFVSEHIPQNKRTIISEMLHDAQCIEDIDRAFIVTDEIPAVDLSQHIDKLIEALNG